MTKRTNLLILAIITGTYFLLSHSPLGLIIFGPIEVLVAFLHEFGHATMAVVTGGHVHALQVNPNGSGVTTTSGGSQSLITIGGYVGSAIFSNLLVQFSLSKNSNIVCYVLAGMLCFAGFFWFSNITNLGILIFYAILFIGLAKIPEISRFILQFIGVACVIHILEDFQVGPSSDLEAFQNIVGIFPYVIWMYLWLGIAIIVTLINIKLILKIKEPNQIQG